MEIPSTGEQKGQRQLVCTPPSNNCVQEGLTSIDAQSPPRPTPTQLHVTQRIGPSKTITPGQVGVVAVTCNPGEIATGGGYTASANVIVASSLAGNSNTAWLVNAFNNSTQNGILGSNCRMCRSITLIERYDNARDLYLGSSSESSSKDDNTKSATAYRASNYDDNFFAFKVKTQHIHSDKLCCFLT